MDQENQMWTKTSSHGSNRSTN